MTASAEEPKRALPRAARKKAGAVPVPALLTQDLVYHVLLAATYGGAGFGTYHALRGLAALVGAWVFLFPGFFLFLWLSTLPAIVLHRILPSVRPGIYKMSDPGFRLWVLRYVSQRTLCLWPFRQLYFMSHVLRFWLLNGLGSKVAFRSIIGWDVFLLDWQMYEVGEGVSVGASAKLFTHFMIEDRLFLGDIAIGAHVAIGSEAAVGPSTRIGEGASIAYRAVVGSFSVLGARASVKEQAVLEERCEVGEDAVVEAFAHVPSGTKIGAGERWAGNPAVRVGQVARRRR